MRSIIIFLFLFLFSFNSFSQLNVSRHKITIDKSLFPSQNSIIATHRNVSSAYIYQISGKTFFLNLGNTDDEDAESIDDTNPSPAIGLKKEDGKWVLNKIFQDVKTWSVRAYKITDNTISVGDGNEIGNGATEWKGDVYQGNIKVDGDIDWFRVNADEHRGYQHGIASADLNGDGFIDVASSPGVKHNFFSIWINNGDGTFTWDEDFLSDVRSEIPGPFGFDMVDLLKD